VGVWLRLPTLLDGRYDSVSMVVGGGWVGVWLWRPTLLDGRYGRTRGRGGERSEATDAAGRSVRTNARPKRTHTQTHRAYKWLQVPPSNLTFDVGNDNVFLQDG